MCVCARVFVSVCVINLLHFFCIDYRLRCCCCCCFCWCSCCCCCCCNLLSGRSLGLRRKRCNKLLQLSERSCVTLAAVALRMYRLCWRGCASCVDAGFAALSAVLLLPLLLMLLFSSFSVAFGKIFSLFSRWKRLKNVAIFRVGLFLIAPKFYEYTTCVYNHLSVPVAVAVVRGNGLFLLWPDPYHRWY